ncbi:MAG: serine/threonine protein kinase [Gemmataceae bacterium]|nr:serine/threonine protein kinase [Gemmataceae bacterium]
MDEPQNERKPAPAQEELSGTTLGDFQIIRRIGQGGMGQVYLAEQISLKRKVALKFLKADLAANPAALNRFRAEAEAVAKISHANIVAVYTVGSFDDRQYMALEYVEGLNLRDYLARKGTPDLPRALLIMRQVASALQRASEVGIVHRDIKPENILLTRKGEVKVTDFGLSRVFGADELHLTQSGMTMGTPLYMSPEQVQGKAVDPRSDIYSFGVTCYHMLAGKPPFTGQIAVEVALRHVNDTAPPLESIRPDLPIELCRVIARMMSKDPAQRPQSGREVLRVLNALRGGSGDLTFPDAVSSVTTPVSEAESTKTVPSLAGESPPRVWIRYAGVGLLAVCLGGTLRFALAPPQSYPESAGIPVADADEDERFLVDTIARYRDASLTPAKAARAFKDYSQLANLYLEQRRLTEAEELIGQITNKDPGLQFLKNLYQGIVFAQNDEPIKALSSWQFAFDDKNYRQYLNGLSTPPSREGVDLRDHLLDAFRRVEKTNRLPGELARVKQETVNFLTRPLLPPPKGKAS